MAQVIEFTEEENILLDLIAEVGENEGWLLVNAQREKTTLEIQKMDEADVFLNDTEAMRHVVILARNNSYVHIGAVELVKKYGEKTDIDLLRNLRMEPDRS